MKIVLYSKFRRIKFKNQKCFYVKSELEFEHFLGRQRCICLSARANTNLPGKGGDLPQSRMDPHIRLSAHPLLLIPPLVSFRTCLGV